MKNLIEIAKIVTKKKINKIEIFDENSLKSKTSKFNEFYEALANDKYKNDRDAAAALYGCDPRDARYRQLKSRFRRRLSNTLFFIDANKASAPDYSQAYFSCNKDWTLVKILIANEGHNAAESMARHILTTAIKFKFADVIVNCARILRAYSADAQDDKEYEEYDALIKTYGPIMEAEIRSEELYQRVIMDYYKPPLQAESLSDRINTYCDALIQLSEHHDSPIITYNMYMVWVMRFEVAQQYDAMIQVCDQVQQYIKDNPDYYQEDKLITFYTKRMSAFLHLGDYKNGKAIAQECLSRFQAGNERWFVFMEFYLLLAMHTENYVHAIAIFNNALSNSYFKKLIGQDKDKWYIFEAYLNFIVEHQQLDKSLLKRNRHGAFKEGHFLESPLTSSKEQRTLEIHRLIVQALLLISKRQKAEASDLVGQLRLFADKKLNKEENFRTIQFIRLMQLLRKNEFQTEDLPADPKYLPLLRSQPFGYRGSVHSLEIIPYETLWDVALDLCQ